MHDFCSQGDDDVLRELHAGRISVQIMCQIESRKTTQRKGTTTRF